MNRTIRQLYLSCIIFIASGLVSAMTIEANPQNVLEKLDETTQKLKVEKAVTLYLTQGNYTNLFKLDKRHSGLTIKADPLATISVEERETIFQLNGVNGFTIDGVQARHTVRACPEGVDVVAIHGSQNVTIQNAKLNGSGYRSVYVKDSQHIVVKDSWLYHFTHAGLQAVNSSNLDIHHNQIFWGPNGVLTENASGKIHENIISHVDLSHKLDERPELKFEKNYIGDFSLPVGSTYGHEGMYGFWHKYRSNGLDNYKNNHIFEEELTSEGYSTRDYDGAELYSEFLVMSYIERLGSLEGVIKLEAYDNFWSALRKGSLDLGGSIIGVSKNGTLVSQPVWQDDGMPPPWGWIRQVMKEKPVPLRDVTEYLLVKTSQTENGSQIFEFVNPYQENRVGFVVVDVGRYGIVYRAFTASNIQGTYIAFESGPTGETYYEELPKSMIRKLKHKRERCLEESTGFPRKTEFVELQMYDEPAPTITRQDIVVRKQPDVQSPAIDVLNQKNVEKLQRRVTMSGEFVSTGYRTCKKSTATVDGQEVEGHWLRVGRIRYADEKDSYRRSGWIEGWVFEPLLKKSH